MLNRLIIEHDDKLPLTGGLNPRFPVCGYRVLICQNDPLRGAVILTPMKSMVVLFLIGAENFLLREIYRKNKIFSRSLLRFAHKISKNRRLGDFLPCKLPAAGKSGFYGTKWCKNLPVQQAARRYAGQVPARPYPGSGRVYPVLPEFDLVSTIVYT
jgi:hypothetical protein